MPFTRFITSCFLFAILLIALVGPGDHPWFTDETLLLATLFAICVWLMSLKRVFFLDVVAIFFAVFFLQRLVVIYFKPNEMSYQEGHLIYSSQVFNEAIMFCTAVSVAILIGYLFAIYTRKQEQKSIAINYDRLFGIRYDFELLFKVYALLFVASMIFEVYLMVGLKVGITTLDFDKFEAQIKCIGRDYGFIKPDDLQDILAGKMKYTGTKVLLTFDDGFKSNALIADKILEPLGIKAIFFIPPGFINAKNRDQQKTFIAKNLYDNCLNFEEISDDMVPMCWQDLERLLAQGHTIGAHTINHRKLTEIESKYELKREIIESGDILQRKLGINVNHFSYPFGDIGSIAPRAMKIIKERYRYCYSGIRGVNRAGTNPYTILRDPVAVDDPPEYFRLILEDILGWLYWKHYLRRD